MSVTHKREVRLLTGFIVAPLIPVVGLMYLSGLGVPTDAGDALKICLPLMYGVALVVGLPLCHVFRRHHRRQFWDYALLGFLAGIPLNMIVLSTITIRASMLPWLRAAPGLLIDIEIFSVLAGAMFWIVARPHRDGQLRCGGS